MSGSEFRSLLCAHVPVVAVSRHSDHETMRRAGTCGTRSCVSPVRWRHWEEGEQEMNVWVDELGVLGEQLIIE